jgi:hypothetical protein
MDTNVTGKRRRYRRIQNEPSAEQQAKWKALENEATKLLQDSRFLTASGRICDSEPAVDVVDPNKRFDLGIDLLKSILTDKAIYEVVTEQLCRVHEHRTGACATEDRQHETPGRGNEPHENPYQIHCHHKSSSRGYRVRREAKYLRPNQQKIIVPPYAEKFSWLRAAILQQYPNWQTHPDEEKKLRQLCEAIGRAWFNARPPVSSDFDEKAAKKEAASRRQILLRFRERIDRAEEDLIKYHFYNFAKELGEPCEVGEPPLPEDFPYRQTEPPDKRHGIVLPRTVTIVLPPGGKICDDGEIDYEALVDESDTKPWPTDEELRAWEKAEGFSQATRRHESKPRARSNKAR